MRRKVIYVSFDHWSEKIERDWYLDHLIENGVAVEYWDLVSLLFGHVDEGGSKARGYVSVPRTYRELETAIRRPENKAAKYIVLLTYEGRFAEVYRLLSKHRCRMYFIAWGALPIRKERISRQVLRGLLRNPLQLAARAFNKLKAAVYRRLNLVRPFDIIFAAGQAELAGARYAAKVVPINLVDYDHYAKLLSETSRAVEGRYAVFLDIYLPHHPDLKVAGAETIQPREYYLSLNRFFGLVESKYGVKVVVAAHPKADYATNPFQGRALHNGITPKLVKDSALVISHHSTSISYAVLNRKPIVFVYTNEMRCLYGDTVVRCLHDFSDYLGAALYNIDAIRGGEEIVVRDVDAGRYENYKYEFLTTRESENTTTREIFWREICLD